MLATLRAPTGWRAALTALALLALALKLLAPAGFMPGTSLAAPIMLCPGQGDMPMAMGDHGRHDPARAPHGGPEHQCSFAGTGAAAVAVPMAPAAAVTITVPAASFSAAPASAAPGRGLAAPPPPSHAPPVFRA